MEEIEFKRSEIAEFVNTIVGSNKEILGVNIKTGTLKSYGLDFASKKSEYDAYIDLNTLEGKDFAQVSYLLIQNAGIIKKTSDNSEITVQISLFT